MRRYHFERFTVKVVPFRLREPADELHPFIKSSETAPGLKTDSTVVISGKC